MDKTAAQTWLTRIASREKVLKRGFWEQAEKCGKLYNAEADSDTENPFNILYANTEVLAPSLYSATPRPDVRMRDSTQPNMAAQAAQTLLVNVIDDQVPNTESFDGAMESAVLSSLVQAAGGVRVRYTPESLCPISFDSFPHDGLVWGPARKWSKVPWIAFRLKMTREDFFEKFKISEADKGKLETADREDSEDGDDDRTPGYCVYELWSKRDRKVTFLCDKWEDKIVSKPVNDPLQLAGFFPTPGPLAMVMKSEKLCPVPLYSYYANQAKELNRVTVRLNKVLAALRVNGAYHGQLGKLLETILSDTSDNKFIPADESMLLQQGGGFDKLIWMLPVDRLINVARELYTARQQIKQVIYELTGISDIIRGSTVASETATAQDLKNKWGTIRLRKMQRSVGLYVRDLLRLSVDLAAGLLDEQEFKRLSFTPAPLQVEKQAAAQKLSMLQAQPQPPGAQPPPELQKLQQTLSQPSVADIQQQLKDDKGRVYLIDIETSSTIDVDASADRQEVGEFMNALAQMLSGLGPLVQAGGPTGFEAAKALLLAVTSRFKLGQQVAEKLKALQAPPPPPQPEGPAGPTPEEQAAAKAEAEYKMAELALKKEQLAAEKELMLAKQQLELDKIALQRQQLRMRAQQAVLQSQLPQQGAPNAPVQRNV